MVEKELLERLNAKQAAAYRELFTAYYRYLVVYAARYVGQQDAAEDIVQEAIVAVWESDRVFASLYGLRVFLYNAVKNRCLNHLKHTEVEKRYLSRLEETPVTDEDLAQMREEMYRELYRAIAGLPERCRRVFEMHLKGMKNEEIARALDLSVLTVKTHKKNAVRYLRDSLGEMFYVMVALRVIPWDAGL